MKVRVLILLTAVAVASLAAPAAHAFDELCTVDSGSAQTSQIDDTVDDGLTGTFGLNAVAPDPTDIVSGWFSRDAAGAVNVNLTVAQLTGTEADFVYYFRWTFPGDNPVQQDRFIRVQPRPYGASFSYGYFDNAAGAYTSVGSVTGTVTNGTPGTITAVLPLDKLGNPQPGDTFEAPFIESKVRAGSPGLPPGSPSGLPSTPGQVFAVDDSLNGAGCDVVTL